MNTIALPKLAARALRTATAGGIAITLALSGTAFAQDGPPPPPSDGPPIVDAEPPGDGVPPVPPEEGTDPSEPEPQPEVTPQPTPQPVTEPPATPEAVTPPPAVPAGTPAKPRKAKKSCKKGRTKKARKACRKRRAAKATRTGVFARSAMQGVTTGSATCSGQQGAKTLRAAAPTVHAGQPFQWIEHWNTVAKWNGSTWAVDGSAWVGPFWTRTDYPGHVYYKGGWYLRSNGGGSSNHYVGGAYAVGVQWIKGHSSNVIDYVYMATTDSMSVTGSPVRWCNG